MFITDSRERGSQAVESFFPLLRQKFNVTLDDVENAISLITPHNIDSFPKNPQNESNENIYAILEQLFEVLRYTLTADEDLKPERIKLSKSRSGPIVQSIFTKYGFCDSYNQLGLLDIVRSV